jgi:predicted Fe-S protein YdhL (DUF1289 family)
MSTSDSMSSDSLPEPPLASPCVSVCTLDPTRAYCIGCLRTVKEIGAWRSMSVPEKRAVIRACQERAKAQEPLGADRKPLRR